MPTDARAANSAPKLPANPARLVATLQQATPKAIKRGRRYRSPKAPNTGAVRV